MLVIKVTINVFNILREESDSHVSIFESKVKEWINSKPYRSRNTRIMVALSTANHCKCLETYGVSMVTQLQ